MTVVTRKALFLDRDGVTIDYIPYLSQPAQVKLPQGAGQALQQWQSAGYLLIVITNQAGIGRGYFDHDAVEAVHQKWWRTISHLGLPLPIFSSVPITLTQVVSVANLRRKC